MSSSLPEWLTAPVTGDELIRDVDNDIDWQAVDQLTHDVHGDLATWWVTASPGVKYYRADLPARHLPGRTVRLEETDVQQVGGKLVFRRQRGAAVWQFPGNDTRAVLMAEQHLQGVPVWVEVDDNYLTHPPLAHLISEWLIKRDTTGQDRSSYEVHSKIVRSKMVAGVICSTPHLAGVYRRMHANVHVCRNAVDPDDWVTEPAHQPDGVLRVGFAGSVSHAFDMAEIRPALDWASRQPDVEVVILGQPDLAAMLGPIPHRLIPWTDTLADYRQSVQQVDVMLCPLRPSLWADCKSDVKAMEGAMGGAAVVVSKTEPFRPWWDGEAPGYVAETAKDFKRIVKHLVRNRDEVRQAAQAAREYVLTERNIHRTVQEWRDALCA